MKKKRYFNKKLFFPGKTPKVACVQGLETSSCGTLETRCQQKSLQSLGVGSNVNRSKHNKLEETV